MAKGYMYVAPATQPKETYAEKFSNIGKQMQAAQMANQKAAMENMRAARKQMNSQLSQLMAPLKNTENWARADIDQLNDIIDQSRQIMRTNPQAFPDLLMSVYNYASQGKSHARVRSGLNNEEEQYIMYQSGEREWPVDGYAAITSADDYRSRVDSYDNMGVPTGDIFTDNSTGLDYEVFEYITPGKNVTVKDMFVSNNQGAQFNIQEDPNTGVVTMIASKDGVPVNEAIIAGPLAFHPGRGSANYFTPQAINVERTTPDDFVKQINPTIVNLRQRVNADDMTESEAREAIASSVAGDFNNSKLGQGMRAEAMSMWEEANPNEEYDESLFIIDENGDSPATDRGIKSPLELYTDAVVARSGVAKTPDRSRGSGGGALNDWPQDREGNGGYKGWTSGLNDDIAPGSLRAQLYDEDVKNIPTDAPRADLFIGNENLEFQGNNYGKIIAFPSQNIILLPKRGDEWMGTPSDLNLGDNESLRYQHIGDSMYWKKDPSSRYIKIYIRDINNQDDPTATTTEFDELSSKFAYRYRRDPSVNKETLLNEILRLAQ